MKELYDISRSKFAALHSQNFSLFGNDLVNKSIRIPIFHQLTFCKRGKYSIVTRIRFMNMNKNGVISHFSNSFYYPYPKCNEGESLESISINFQNTIKNKSIPIRSIRHIRKIKI